ncbi:MAG: hemolysin family protein [Planctomycetota bacterium]
MPSGLPYLPLRLAVLGVTFCLSAFFSGSETALFSFQPHELQGMADQGRVERIIAGLRRRPKRLLITVLFGNMVANVVFYSFSFLLIVDLKPRIGATAGFVLGLASLLAIIVGGEVVPKNLAALVYKPWGRAAAFPMFLLEHALLPVVIPLEKLVDFVVELIGRGREQALRAEELQELVGLAAREGTFDFGAGRMIAEVIGLSEVRVNELMVPRVEMVTFDVEEPEEELLELFHTSKLTMIPVYRETMDQMLGVIHVKDVLYRPPDRSLQELARPIPFMPETSTVEEALRQCRREQSKTAFVVDEYGAVVGLITIEDLLEEIVGEIADEYDTEIQPPVQVLEDGTFRLRGRLSLRSWAELFEVEVPDMDVTTVGGLVMSLLGKLPEAGDRVEYERMQFTVESVHGRRVESVLVRTQPSQAVEQEGGAAHA